MDTLPRRRMATLAAGLLALAAATGCGKDDGTGPGSSYVGGWAGTTSQGKILRFFVAEPGIVIVALGFRVEGTSCTEDIIVFLAREAPDEPYEVAGNILTVQTSGSGGSINLTGTFSSASQVSGTLQVNSITCGGSISETWTATKASGPEIDVTGIWEGTFESSLLAQTPITFTLSQSGGTVSGSYFSSAGGSGTVSGTVSGKLVAFTLTQTTQNCRGSFQGHAVVVDQPEFIFFALGGSDCLGTHRDAGGFADRQ